MNNLASAGIGKGGGRTAAGRDRSTVAYLGRLGLLGMVLFLVLIVAGNVSATASAAMPINGFIARDSGGAFHQYSYEDLIDSYAMGMLGMSNGLYDDFAAKKTYALLGAGNRWIDYPALLDQYARMLILGEYFDLRGYIVSKEANLATMPAHVQLVSLENGKLVRTIHYLEEQAGEGSEDSPSDGEALPDEEGDCTKPTDPDESQEMEKPDQCPDGDDSGNSGAIITNTPIVGAPALTQAQAEKWAKRNNAHQRFVDVAGYYWAFGAQSGIRPEVLFAQAAVETGFGRFGGQVTPEHNNWAGIKTATSNGDEPEDHERFSSPQEGARAHFNHMAAYIGLSPLGEPHDRYHVVIRTPWAGTIETVEELSGRWAVSSTYHVRIVEMIEEMAAD